jgi:hypothetical protein
VYGCETGSGGGIRIGGGVARSSNESSVDRRRLLKKGLYGCRPARFEYLPEMMLQDRKSITKINRTEDSITTIGKPNAPYNAIKKHGVKLER